MKRLIVLLIVLLCIPAIAKADSRRGSVTNMGSANVPFHYGATTHGNSLPTFKDNSVLRVTHRAKVLIVKVTDVCDGSACRMLDLSLAGFKSLGFTESQGVGKVTVYCGRGGNLPMRKCLAGEDK